MVDLSKPGELWFTLETLVSTLTTYLEMSLKNSSQDSEETLNKKRSSADYELHPDKDHIRPFPLPLIILGGRYDEFQNFEPEKKKIICKALRFFAHYHGASLQFYRYLIYNSRSKFKSNLYILLLHFHSILVLWTLG